MAYGDPIRDADYTREELASLVEGVFAPGAGLVNWQSWTPVVSGTGGMTVTLTTLNAARFMQINKMVYFYIGFTATIGGTPTAEVRATLPPITSVPDSQIFYCRAVCHVRNAGSGGDSLGFGVLRNLAGVATCAFFNSPYPTNWTVGTGRNFRVSGFFEAA